MYTKAVLCGAVALAAHASSYKIDRDGAHEHASAPSSGYEEPAEAYAAPAETYGAPAPSYSSAEASTSVPDLTPIIIGILVLTGLSLLFPTYVTLTSVRRKRSVDGVEGTEEEAGGLSNVIERVQDIYMAVLESEECMERVACEVGGLAEDAGLPKTVFHLAEPYVPKKYNKFVKKFNTPKDCHKIKCGNFF